MTALRCAGLTIAGIVCFSGAVLAQNAISTKAGTINSADGDVYIGDQLYIPKINEIKNIPEGEVFRTAEGRAEVLLTPGSFLRMPEATSFKLEKNSLSYVVVQVVRGSVLLEVTELLPDNHIRIKVADAALSPLKAGLYRIDAEPTPRIRVFEGEAEVQINDDRQVMKGGRELLASGGTWVAAKFDSKETDGLYRWAKRRSEYIAMANRSSARSSFAGSGPWSDCLGRWAFNSYFGTMTYVPCANTMFSPFGYAYYTPYTVYRLYAPRPVYSPPPNYGGGANSPGFARGPYYSGSSNLPGRSATASYGGGSSPSAPSAPGGGGGASGGGSAPRSGGDSGARGGAGGGRGQ